MIPQLDVDLFNSDRLFDKVALRRGSLGAIRVNALDLALSEVLLLVNVLVFVEFPRDCLVL